ncbi:MAG: four helix bundle suffix domain-containing protein [Desulfovibrionales bacterium]
MDNELLLPKHGGYRKLKSFQIAQLVYDLTVRFCELYVDRFSRTKDQMVQAARSGVQNIAEGSLASGTSKKTELKLTNVARASLEELRLDYEDFLRQRGVPMLEPGHPAMVRFRRRRCASLEAVQEWVRKERGTNTDPHGRARTDTDSQSRETSVRVRVSPCSSVFNSSSVPSSSSVSSSALVANAALSLLNLCCHLLDRQIAAQAAAFAQDGGFSERLYRVRSRNRKKF